MPAFAFTFDDGPDPKWTPKLLSLLDRLEIKATFFPLASRAAAFPELVRRAQRAGHTIGLHCFEHVRHSDRDQGWVEHDTEIALDLLSGIGVAPALWRTPWGDTADFTQPVADANGLRIVGWTLDTHDWRGDSAEQMLGATRQAITPGAIVLAHDGIGPGATRSDVAQTLRYVEQAAEVAKAHGLEMEALR